MKWFLVVAFLNLTEHGLLEIHYYNDFILIGKEKEQFSEQTADFLCQFLQLG